MTEPRRPEAARIVAAMPWREVKAQPRTGEFKQVAEKVAAFKRATASGSKRGKRPSS